MSINLGNEGIAALKELRASAHFAAFRTALHAQVVRTMNATLDAETTTRHEVAGYAKGLRDLWMAVESAVTDTAYNQVKKPGGAVPAAAVVEKSSAAR